MGLAADGDHFEVMCSPHHMKVMRSPNMTFEIVSFLPVQSLIAFRRISSCCNSALEVLLAKSLATRTAFQTYIDSVLAGTDGNDKRVWVGVRLRPQEGCDASVAVARNQVTVTRGHSVGAGYVAARSARSDGTSFFFDRVFDGSATQAQVYQSIQTGLMRRMMRHESACILAYGQTGSGKTHTMFGSPEVVEGRGIAFRVLEDLSKLLQQEGNVVDGELPRPTVEFSFLEVYNEKVHDLLGNHRVCELAAEFDVLKPAGKYSPAELGAERVAVKGLTRRPCEPSQMEQQVGQWLQEGAASRIVGRTVCNERSSRSHAVATLHICWPNGDGAASNKETRLYLVDLAGSERAGQYAVGATQLKEGCHINLSLSTLGRVVGSLARGQGEHVPYRDSALTWLLSDAITGRNAKAFMIAAVQPAHPEETLSTLIYARNYSSLRSRLSQKIPLLKSSIRRLQCHFEQAKYEFESHCYDLNNSGRPGNSIHWTKEMLQQTLVRARPKAQSYFSRHPCLKWIEAHEGKTILRVVGQVREICDVPPPRGKDEEPDGRRKMSADAEQGPVIAGDRAVKVVYAGRHGHKDVILWFPWDAVEEVRTPERLQALLQAYEDAELALRNKQRELQEAQKLFEAQMLPLMS